MSTLTKTEERPGTVAEPAKTAARFLTPPANIRETKDEYVLEVEMPGVNTSGLDISVENNELIIWGRRSDPELTGDIYYRESRWLDYRRVFDLDPSIDASKITAKIEQGIVTLHLPKAEQVKPRKIAVT